MNNKQPTVFLSALQCRAAPYAHRQQDILKFMHEQLAGSCHPQLDVLYRASGIQRRHSFLPDFGIPKNPPFFTGYPQIHERMSCYFEAVVPFCTELAQACLHAANTHNHSITHLITVSCTGMAAPGLDLHLMKSLQLSPHTFHTAIHFMGCHAAFHALRLAHALAQQSPKNRVLVVDVEFCSLHFTHSTIDDQLLAQSLFADGAAACLVSLQTPHTPYIELVSFQSHYLPAGHQHMAWEIGHTAFFMQLSRYVPSLLEEGIKRLLAHDLKTSRSDHWAIHPGGKGILDACQKALGLNKEQLRSSYHVLRHYGNMSSVSIFFVLEHLLTSKAKGSCRALAFGPGLTMESAQLRLLP